MEDYKEKYEKLYRFVNDLYPHMSDYCKEKVDGYFPELKESEDEKIRKEMIEILRKEVQEFPSSVIAEKSNSWIAWLEKQGEQKSEEVDNLHNYLYDEQKPADEVDNYDHKKVLQTIINEQNPVWSEEDEPQKELAETYLAVFDKKFPILPTLKGKKLADYKNFLNKCQQILGLKYWSIRPLQAKLFEKLSLLWAAWGAEHLKGLGQTNKEIGSTWHGNKISDTDIEYTRTDAFIEKATEWLKKNADGYTWYDEMEGESGMTDEFIDDFKKYMEGE